MNIDPYTMKIDPHGYLSRCDVREWLRGRRAPNAAQIAAINAAIEDWVERDPDGYNDRAAADLDEAVRDILDGPAVVKITSGEARDALVALREHADDDGLVTGSAADEAVWDMSDEVRQVIACDADGGTSAAESWAEPATLYELEADLNAAARGEFTLPDHPAE